MKIFNAVVSVALACTMLSSCASKKRERVPKDEVHKDLSRDYQVTEASSGVRPGWIEDAEIWAREHGRDIEAYRYFSFETEPKASRSIACSLARANATADIAREISTFINQSLTTSTYGDASIDPQNPNINRLRQYVETTLAEKVQGQVSGARVIKTYWEKRNYQQRMGAPRDYQGWTCAAFIQMDGEQLGRLIDFAVSQVFAQAETNREARDLARAALEEANEAYLNLKTGRSL